MRSEALVRLLESVHPLSQPFKVALEENLQFVTCPKNHFLVQMSSQANPAYFLESGFAVAYSLFEGKRVVTAFFQPGEMVLSPGSCFAPSGSDEVIQLTMVSDVLSISNASVTRLSDEFPEANLLARAITAQFHSRSIERLVDLHTLNAWERYQKLLKTYPHIELNASQDLIASYLNITPQSLSRLRHRNARH